MASEIGERINRVIDLKLTPLLTEAGFQRERKTFYCVTGEQTQIISIRSGKYNHGDRGTFCVYFGVFLPRLHDLWDSQALKNKPALRDCQLVRQLNHLMPCRETSWWEDFSGTFDQNSDEPPIPSPTNTRWQNRHWKLHENSDDDALAICLAEAVRDYGLPWLDMCSEPAQARDHLESAIHAIMSKRLIFSVELLLKLDIAYFGRDRARATLDRLIESNSRGWLFKWISFKGWMLSRPTKKEIHDYLTEAGGKLGLM